MSLKQVTLGSLAMSSVGILRILSQIVAVPIVARYLNPHDYGIMAMAMPFILFAMMISDAGISLSLIRSKNISKSEWSTSHWFVALLGGGISLAMCGLGFLMSLFMQEPILFPVISILSLSILFQCLATVPGAALQHCHRYPTLAGIDIVSLTSSLAITVISAIAGYGVWALVFQQISQFLIKLILTLVISPFQAHLLFKLPEIIPHLRFGRDMLAGNFVTFLRQSISNSLLGRILGPAPLGIFTMANLFSDLPGRVVSGPLQVVLYSRMAQLKDNKEALGTLFVFVSRILSILIVPSFGMVAIAHEPVFTLLLSEKWQQAGHLFLLLAPAGILGAITALRGTILMSLGKTDILLQQSAIISVVSVLAITCFAWFGIEWATVSVSAISVLLMPYFLNQSLTLIDLSVNIYLRSILLPILVTSVSAAVFLFCEEMNWTMIQEFSVAVSLGLLALGVSLLLQLKTIKHEIGAVKDILSQGALAGTDPSLLEAETA